MQKADWSAPSPAQIAYAELDVTVLEPVLAGLSATLTNPVYLFDKRSLIACLRLQRYGLPVDHAAARREIRKTRTFLKSDLARLPFNPNSPKQTASALCIASTGDRFLAEEIAAGNETAAIVRQARKLRKHLNFLEKLTAHPRFSGTMKPNARSGRATSDHNNIQNLPRAVKPLIAVASDRVLIAADFEQLELRTIACLSEDREMIRLFREGADLHNFVAAQLFGAGHTAQERQIAKTFNFSLLYGAGAPTVRSMLLSNTGINMPEFEVQQLKREWLATFSGIAAWQKQGGSRHDLGLPHHTPQGRFYTSKRFTDHLSIENQGAGAEVARLALHKITDDLPPPVDLINFVHDSYLAEAPADPSVYEPAAAVFYQAMKVAWERAPFDKHGVPMPVDVGVARNWEDADKLKNCFFTYGDNSNDEAT